MDELGELLSDEVDEGTEEEAEVASFDPSTVLSDSTIDAGYDSVDPVESSLLNKIILVLVVIGAIFLVILRVCCNKVSCIKNCL